MPYEDPRMRPCTDCALLRFRRCTGSQERGAVWGGCDVPPEVRDQPVRCTAFRDDKGKPRP